MALFYRLVRSDMMATLRENYLLSARARGLSDRYILFRHALRPSS
jgi:peptide/nickel transport system permease protein